MNKNKPDVLISRGYIGYLSQKFAKIKKIKTVREVHANILEEINQYKKGSIVKKILLPIGYYIQTIDKQSDMRIFNHPSLLNWFKTKFRDINTNKDRFVYNGFDFKNKSKLTKSEARKKFGLKQNLFYLVFTGGANYWHGVNYLAELQKEFNFSKTNIQILCGGGKISSSDDPNQLLINLTPLDNRDCSDLIQASDACILPVRQSRTSPGNALKLYEYFLHKKFVITQKNLLGYSDELEIYGYGTLVDFAKPKIASKLIIHEFSSRHRLKKFKIKISSFSWDNRMNEWIKYIKK